MIFGGVFERFPGLKLCAAHGGGYFPFYLGRFEQSYRERKECREHISKSPAEFVRHIWFDTVVLRPDAIGHLADVVGADRVMLGTDGLYDIGREGSDRSCRSGAQSIGSGEVRYSRRHCGETARHSVTLLYLLEDRNHAP